MREIMIYREIIFLRAVLDTIRAEVKRAPRTETGGALVGYLTSDNALFVTHASGPGPRAELRRTSVLIDGEYASGFCDKLFREYGGRVDYVGDWHRHPTFSPLRASVQDLDAMLTIKESNCCSVPFPITAIFRSTPERIVAYALVDDGFKRVRIRQETKSPMVPS
jgi:integrative and conjugative element protein (TIGR02256 family)